MPIYATYRYAYEKRLQLFKRKQFHWHKMYEMNELAIRQRIYEIRGQRVMLDRDLAALYEVETRALNQAVKRNMKRFEGDDFMFQLTKDKAYSILSRSQNVILNNGRGSNIKYLPYAFTELGVAMLSSVLKSETAININRGIMRAFVYFRQLATSLPQQTVDADIAQLRKDFDELKQDIEDILHDQNDINESTRMQIDSISTALAELQSKEPRQHPRRRIGFIQDDKQ